MEEFNFSKEEMKQIKELLLERSKNGSKKKEKEDIFNDKMAKLGFSNMKPKILSNARVFRELAATMSGAMQEDFNKTAAYYESLLDKETYTYEDIYNLEKINTENI